MTSFKTKPRIPTVTDQNPIQSRLPLDRSDLFSILDEYFYLPETINHDHPQTKVSSVIKAFYDAFFPWSFDGIISSIKVCFSGIIRHKANIIHPFMVSERCSPHAFSIAVFLPDKSLFLCAVQSFIHIAQMFPVSRS